MKNILITGGAGYIGSHIVEKLINIKKKVTIIDNLSTGYKRLIHKKAKFYLCDIKNFKKVDAIIKDNNIDTIIHLAALLSVGEGERKPKKYYLNNVGGTRNIINSCVKNKVENFIFSSTCAVYKDKLKIVKENSILEPKSVYGKSKLACEKMIKHKFKNKKINYAILRYFNVAGASESGKVGQISSGDQLFKNLSLASKKQKPTISVYGGDYNTYDGTCIRDYIHVSDISKIHLLVLNKIKKNKRSIVLNCGYGKGISVLEGIRAFQKETKKKFVIRYKPRRKGDMEEIKADNSRIKKFLNWKPKSHKLKKIVKTCIKWENSKQY